MNREPQRDSGYFQVFEAILLALLLLSASTFVLTFTHPTTPRSPEQANVRSALEDALQILYERPFDDPRYGSNWLSKVLADALSGDPTNLTQSFSRILPPGTLYNIYLSNGYSVIPVYESGDPPGETVTALHPIQPQWSYLFLGTSLEVHDASKEYVDVHALPIFNSNVALSGGVPVELRIRGLRDDGTPFEIVTSKSTIEVDSSYSSSTPAVNFALFDTTSGARTSYVSIYNPANRTQSGILVFWIAEKQGVSIPKGTTISVNVPRGWKAIARQSENTPYGWRVLSNSTNSNLSGTVSAVSTQEIPARGWALFKVQATYEGDLGNHHLFGARLGGTVGSSLDFDVYTGPLPSSKNPPPFPTFGLPKPVGSNAEIEIPLGLTNGVKGSTLRIREIEIVQPWGIKLFDRNTLGFNYKGLLACGDFLPAPTSESAVSRLLWRWNSTRGMSLDCSGGINVKEDKTFWATLTIQGAATPTPRTLEEGIVVPVTFFSSAGTFLGNLTQEKQVGFLHGFVPPKGSTVVNGQSSSRRGYEWSNVNNRYVYFGDLRYRGSIVSGMGSYSSTVAPTLTESLSTGSINFSAYYVPVGTSVVISPNIQSLVADLLRSGKTVNITTEIYGPFSIERRVPLYVRYSNPSAAFNGSVTSIAPLLLNSDSTTDLVVGTTSGRVVGLDGEQGMPIPGREFVAETLKTYLDQGQTASVSTLEVVNLSGSMRILVGTSEKSAYIYLLNPSDFRVEKRFSKLSAVSGGVVLFTDSSLDLSGDGVRDVAVVLGTSSNAGKLLVLDGRTFEVLGGWPVDIAGSPGRASEGIFGFQGTPGVVGLVGLQATSRMYRNITISSPPQGLANVVNSIVISTSTTTLNAYGKGGRGNLLWTYSPPSDVSDFTRADLDSDGVTDVVIATQDGYVSALNGKQGSPLLTEIQVFGPPDVIRGQFRPPWRAWLLLSDGEVLSTQDAFDNLFYSKVNGILRQPMPLARGIFFRDNLTGLVVGAGNTLWSSTDGGRSFNLLGSVTFRNSLGLPSTSLWNFNDVSILPDGTAWIVGNRCANPLDNACREAAIFKTTVAGNFQDWTKVSSGGYASGSGNSTWELRKIFLYSSDRGLVVGDHGGLLCRSPTNPLFWKVLPTGTTYDLTDVVMDSPNHGFAVGKRGIVLEIKNLDSCSTAEVLNLTSVVGQGGKDLYSVAAWGSRLLVGGEDFLAESLDRGASFVPLPGLSQGTVIRTLGIRDSKMAYGAGGNPTNPVPPMRLAIVGSYRSNVSALSQDYTPSGLPPGYRITSLSLKTDASVRANGALGINVSFDGGRTWIPLRRTSSDPDNLGNSPYLPITIPYDSSGTSFRFRVDMSMDPSLTVLAPQLRLLNFTVQATSPSGPPIVRTVLEDFKNPSRANLTGTTAVWDGSGVLYPPTFRPPWVQKLNGLATTLRTHSDVNGDGIPEISVATSNEILNGVPNPLRFDSSTYLLDGRTGKILWKAPSRIGGPPTALSLASFPQETGDGIPEVTVSFFNETSGRAKIFVLNGRTGALVDTRDLSDAPERVTSLAGGVHAVGGTSRPLVFAGTVGTAPLSLFGEAWGFEGNSSSGYSWRSLALGGGNYSFEYFLGRGMPFGPYVVVTRVSWNTLVDGAPLLQTARVFGYFVATPPDGVPRVSPIYNVKVVAWFPDWFVLGRSS